MIQTIETTREWAQLFELNETEVLPKANLRALTDIHFIKRGFQPRFTMGGEAFAEYHNPTADKAVRVTLINTFNDALQDNSSWVIIKRLNMDEFGRVVADKQGMVTHTNYICHYNTLVDFGSFYDIRSHSYTDIENSENVDLQDSLNILIKEGFAYEL